MTPETLEERARCLQIVAGVTNAFSGQGFSSDMIRAYQIAITDATELAARAILNGVADPMAALAQAAAELYKENV